MAPASKENGHQTKAILKKVKGPRLNPFLTKTSWLFMLFFARCDHLEEHLAHREAASSPDLCYDILQFLFEDDEEFFGGLCGGLKDLERLRLLALLPLLPEAALLATE